MTKFQLLQNYFWYKYIKSILRNYFYTYIQDTGFHGASENSMIPQVLIQFHTEIAVQWTEYRKQFMWKSSHQLSAFISQMAQQT